MKGRGEVTCIFQLGFNSHLQTPRICGYSTAILVERGNPSTQEADVREL
jgi:hypothetical protein